MMDLRMFFLVHRDSLINMWQSKFYSIKPKLEMGLFVDLAEFTCFCLFLHDVIIELFHRSKQNNFRFWSGKFSQLQVKTQKSTNNPISSFGLIEKNMELSHIYQAVLKENSNKKSKLKKYLTEDWSSHVGCFTNILGQRSKGIS